jgi:hypothetical protein
MKLEDTQTEMYQRAREELLPGEDILWVGRSNPRGIFSGGSGGNKANLIGVIVGLQVLLVLGGVFFAVASSGSTSDGAMMGPGSTTVTTTSSSGPPLVVMMVIAVAILTALIAAVGVPLAQARKGRNMIYAITDRRVLMIGKDSVQSYGEQDIQFIKRKMNKDGTGDIIFREEARAGTAFSGSNVYGSRAYTTLVGFFGVSDPHAVEELMLETFRPEAYARKRKNDEDLWDEEEYFEDSDRSATSGSMK